MPLTVTAVRNVKPAGKPQRLHDSAGLYLEIAPAGGRWWRFAYRFGGKRKLISLGVFPTISLAEARSRRDEARRLLADGIDPSATRKAAKQEAVGRAANSFDAVAREWYAKQAKIWVPHHASDVLRRLEANLFPDLGGRPIADITAPELLAAVRKIEYRGAHDLAHRVLQVASQVFRYGVATGRCERDPAPDLRGALTPHKSRKQAAVKPDDVPELLRAIAGYDKIGDRQTALALRLLGLTFVRTGELIGAEWAEFDLDSAAWIVPASRMKVRAEHVVPLSRQALEVLEELRSLAGNSRYVLPGRNPDKPISNNTMLFALYRLGYKRRMTGHGFREIASTLLNESGFRGDVVERQLAHCERNDVRGAYNRAEYLPERRAMMQQYADMLDALAEGAKVIPLQRTRESGQQRQ
ncbi:MAG TPA: integrase arm-type DNA-binding domain-containing protein [Casimicrobiaceae bacterium]|nr:integrase arm-type DNA-binding domain-containing protein [Casimicrobiaceae bacterium]